MTIVSLAGQATAVSKLIFVLVFDNGYLKESPVAAQKVIDVLLSDMGVRPENDVKGGRESLSAQQLALVNVHRTVWEKISKS